MQSCICSWHRTGNCGLYSLFISRIDSRSSNNFNHTYTAKKIIGFIYETVSDNNIDLVYINILYCFSDDETAGYLMKISLSITGNRRSIMIRGKVMVAELTGNCFTISIADCGGARQLILFASIESRMVVRHRISGNCVTRQKATSMM